MQVLKFEKSAFIDAVRRNDALQIEWALKECPDAHTWTNTRGETALMIAINNGALRAIHALLKGGADPNAQGISHYTPLLQNLFARSETVTLALIDKGAGVNWIDAEDDRRRNILMYATALDESSAVIKALLDKGADTFYRDTMGKSVLDYRMSDEARRLIQTRRDEALRAATEVFSRGLPPDQVKTITKLVPKNRPKI